MNSILGSVVPLAMFLIIFAKCVVLLLNEIFFTVPVSSPHEL